MNNPNINKKYSQKREECLNNQLVSWTNAGIGKKKENL